MFIEIKRKIGDSVFTFKVEEENTIDALFNAGSLASAPTKCELCGKENVGLTGNKAKGYTFVKIVCKDCGAVSQLGQYKEGGIFWKKFEKYQPTGEQSDPFNGGDIPTVED